VNFRSIYRAIGILISLYSREFLLTNPNDFALHTEEGGEVIWAIVNGKIFILILYFILQRIVFDSLLTHLNSQEYNELNGLLAICCLSSLFNNPGMPNKFKDVLKFNFNKKPEVSIKIRSLICIS